MPGVKHSGAHGSFQRSLYADLQKRLPDAIGSRPSKTVLGRHSLLAVPPYRVRLVSISGSLPSVGILSAVESPGVPTVARWLEDMRSMTRERVESRRTVPPRSVCRELNLSREPTTSELPHRSEGRPEASHSHKASYSRT